MSTLRALKRLILGETWLVPLGIAATLALGGLLPDVAGVVLVAGVLLVLLVSVARSGRPSG